MQNALHRSIRIGLLSMLAAAAFGPVVAFAQGSAGGSIGNDEKSLSGSREAPRSAEPARRSRSKPEAAEPRRAARTGGGSSGGNFDGAWMVMSIGCGGTTTGAVMVTSGRIIAQGVSGNVSPNGSARTTGNFGNGITATSSGHFSGRSGSGTWRQSTGCGGTWTATKQ